jgi:hypothetical protein
MALLELYKASNSTEAVYGVIAEILLPVLNGLGDNGKQWETMDLNLQVLRALKPRSGPSSMFSLMWWTDRNKRGRQMDGTYDRSATEC